LKRIVKVIVGVCFWSEPEVKRHGSFFGLFNFLAFEEKD